MNTLYVPLWAAFVTTVVLMGMAFFSAEAWLGARSKVRVFEAQQIRPAMPIPESELPGTVDHPAGYIYLLQGTKGYYKIGYTRDPKDRLRTFANKLPFDVEYLHLIETDNTMRAEKLMHTVFAHRHARGEWYRLTESDIAIITAITKL